VLLVLALLLSGCTNAKIMTEDEIAADPRLAIVHQEFIRAVDDTHAHPTQTWHAGWLGNSIVNFWGGGQKGLCYHWQQQIYALTRHRIESLGLAATGVMINRGKGGEHHCVLVFDPRVIDEQNLLTQPMPRHGWVLDAWQRGEPDIYTLDEWHKLPAPLYRDWELQDLTNIADLPGRRGSATSGAPPPVRRLWESEAAPMPAPAPK